MVPRLRSHRAAKGIALDLEPLQVSPIHKTFQHMLRKFCVWQHQSITDKTHDVALLLSRNMICKNATSKDSCTTLGVAEVGSMCRKTGCAIVRDKGLFTSYTIAHEIGHTLSMPHDEDKKCEQFNKGFVHNSIMNKMPKYDTTPLLWSPCSRHFATDFLDSNKARCLYTPPSKNYVTSSYLSVLPGDKFEVDRQCDMEFGSGSKICPYQVHSVCCDIQNAHCDLADSNRVSTSPLSANLNSGHLPVCEHLWCTTNNGSSTSNGGCKTQWSPWAEGTKCGPNSWCYQRKCVPKNKEDVIPIDGGWGPWQEFGPCSRTCGGGIKASHRNCDSPVPINGGTYCTGESVRYISCNTMDCEAGTDDFRALQCAAFNGITKNLPNLTSTVEWVPKYGLENPEDFCRLYCRPKKSSAYYLLKDKVLDGTKCGLTSFNICINGICRPGGCDNKLESKMALGKFFVILNRINDDCGICGGDNSHCQEVSGTYDKLAPTSGYNSVVKIPKGSSNINITQSSYPYRIDENYLALVDGQTKEYILNGNYIAVTHETDIVFGSLIIKYSGTNATPEWITTPKNHKLTKDLWLEVLSVGNLTSPRITYKYIINRDQAPSFCNNGNFCKISKLNDYYTLLHQPYWHHQGMIIAGDWMLIIDAYCTRGGSRILLPTTLPNLDLTLYTLW
ncbi:hypothetical protein NQ318_011256 [Aromia moschata]|uniref:Peptidase M12B domain-containing protein n=1 Tax=Aromia moschata TaxID=1265417 RepID=A0AAV8YGA5_9CUCU|nr:hypothetical protein NQ318_011256 [Aromia moschata]